MRVLIVKTSSLGDIIHVFPVLSFLQKEFPQIKIDWVVEKSFADIVKAHPLVNEVIEIDTKSWRKKLWKFSTWRNLWKFRRILKEQHYDAIFDLQGNLKSALSTFLARSAHKVGFGLKTVHEWPNTLVTHHRFNPPLHLNVRNENLYVVQHYYQRFSSEENEKIVLQLNDEQQKIYATAWSNLRAKSGQKILVCPGSAWKNKQLAYETLEAFLGKLHHHLKDVEFIVTWGTPEELIIAQKLQKAILERIQILDKVPLPVLQNLMGKMDLVIAMDSLPLHLAGTSGTPTFSVFGASSAQKYKPLGIAHKTLQGSCPYGKVFERRCPILRSCSTGLCIQGLTANELFEEFCKS